MDKETQLQHIEESRQRTHKMIDEQYDALIKKIESGEPITISKYTPERMSLMTSPRLFKGHKPSEIIFPDGRSVETKTWREAVTDILQDCNADEQMHDTLMYLRGRTAGRLRYILSHDPEELDVPLKIDEGLYFEGKFDTEYLLKMLTERVLKPSGYPCQDITVVLRQPQTAELANGEEQDDDIEDAEDEAPTMQMM